jgi:hypothetical protein
VLAPIALLAWSLTPTVSGATDPVTITVLSNRADLISGGDALVAVDTPSPAQTTLTLDGGAPITGFLQTGDSRLEGLLTGMAVGEHVLKATLPDAGGAQITITNHPNGGPLFSGPQIQPWYCLPDALDAQCNRPVKFDYSYKSSVTGQFAAYDPANPPADLATTTTDQGKTVPYIVRVETGTQDRSQYQIAVLVTPDEAWTRWTGPAAWNHKVYVLHGGGCSMAHGEAASVAVLNDTSLKRGFAVMSTALINNTHNCNLVVQAESLMMAKEHLIESYGDLRYMFGQGGSGGAIAQLWIANAYPGLYDGLIVGATMPDAPINDLLDCVAMHRYFDSPTKWAPGVMWSEPSEAAASGKASTSVCRLWTTPGGPTGYAQVFDPRVGVGCDVPSREPAKVYHPTNNPGGVRCSLQDYLVNILGLRPQSLWGPIEQGIGHGFADRPFDNVGVQYGLRALQSGQITPAQFVDLNAKVGAVDIDFGTQPERIAAGPDGVAAAYRSGLVNEGNNLDRVPIIDLPGGLNVPGDRYEIHDIYKSWMLRSRLDEFNGHHDNHVLWYGLAEQRQDYFSTMDKWLAAMETDHRDVPLEQKVVEDRPAAAKDACDFPDRATCDTLFGPGFASTRWGAGDGIATDVVKCRLQPLVRSDYLPILFTDAEWASLQMTFPSGVCDWSQPGVEQQPTVAWQGYQAGPGGQPLAVPPVSEPL